MAQGRFISKSIAKDKRLNSLGIEAELLYLMAIPHLDRDGLINGDAHLLWSDICPQRVEFFTEMESFIAEWIDSGLVIAYDVDEGRVLWFKGFAKNQQGMRYDREGESRFSPPPGYVRNSDGLVSADEAEPVQTDSRPTPDPLPTHSRQSTAQGQVQDQVQDQVHHHHANGSTKPDDDDDDFLSEVTAIFEESEVEPKKRTINAIRALCKEYGRRATLDGLHRAADNEKLTVLSYIRTCVTDRARASPQNGDKPEYDFSKFLEDEE